MVIANMGAANKEYQQAVVDAMFVKLKNIEGISVMTAVSGDRLSIYAASAVPEVKAGDLIKELAPIADAKGGGRPDRAQAGSKSVHKEALVLSEAERILTRMLGS